MYSAGKLSPWYGCGRNINRIPDRDQKQAGNTGQIWEVCLEIQEQGNCSLILVITSTGLRSWKEPCHCSSYFISDKQRSNENVVFLAHNLFCFA